MLPVAPAAIAAAYNGEAVGASMVSVSDCAGPTGRPVVAAVVIVESPNATHTVAVPLFITRTRRRPVVFATTTRCDDAETLMLTLAFGLGPNGMSTIWPLS